MENKDIELKKGVKLHTIQTDKFKTNLIAVMLTTKLDRKTVTKNALIPAVLRRGTANLHTQEEINKKLEEMYGASLDCGLDKTGDNQVLKFYIESLNDEFLPQSDENMLKSSLEILFDVVFNPFLENNSFKKEYIEQERENLRQIILSKIDNKARYALDKCIEAMYKDDPYELYKYGYIEDLDGINEQNLYEYYQEFINQCKIDIYVSGILDDKLEDFIKKNENIAKLKDREPQYIKPEIKSKKANQEKVVTESMDVTQGKLVIGLDLELDNEDLRYDAMIYNSLLGGSATSKIFQNVREKASLAYTASSSYARRKQNIFIRAGIEIENYDKAVEIIEKQLQDMKEGNFSEEDLSNAKNLLLSTIENIPEEQDTEITYYFGQELAGTEDTIEMYQEKIKNVTKEDVIDVANKIQINTIYFLTNQGGKE